MKPYNPKQARKVRIAKKISSAIALFFIALVVFAMYTTLANPVVTEPKPTPAPAPCELQCLVEKRADAIHKRDQTEYRQQSDLKALIEIQAELQLLTIEHKN